MNENEVLGFLHKKKFLKWKSQKKSKAQFKLTSEFSIARVDLLSSSHPRILTYYNAVTKHIHSRFHKCQNEFAVSNVLKALTKSCALTLSRKFSFNSVRRTIYKLGKGLAFDFPQRKRSIRNKTNPSIIKL